MYRTLLTVWRKLQLKKSSQIQVMRLVNDKFLIGVTGVIFNHNLEVLLVEHTYRRVAWSLPGGYLQAGEHPKNGLKREIREETGFKVRIDRIIQTKHDEETARLDMCCVGTYEKGEFKKSHEVTGYGFFPVEKLPDLLDDQYEQIRLGYEQYKKLHALPKLERFIRFFGSSK